MSGCFNNHYFCSVPPVFSCLWSKPHYFSSLGFVPADSMSGCVRSTYLNSSVFYFTLLLLFFIFFMAVPMAYGSSQARAQIRVAAEACAIATATLDQTHICDLYHSLRKSWILSPLRKARDQTHILIDTSLVCNSEPQWELPAMYFQCKV